MIRNGRISETQVLRKLEALVEAALPPAWSSRLDQESGTGRRRADSILRISASDGATATFLVEAKRSLAPRALVGALDRLLDYIAASGTTPLLPLVAAPYFGPRSRELLAERGVSYVDSTGNLRIVAQSPGLFLERVGASKDPWPDDQPLVSLRGRGAARAVRALVDFRPSYGVRELSSRAGVSAATLSRVIDLLARDYLLTRDESGRVTDVDWAAVIRRWAQDYDLRRSNNLSTYLEPRGLTALTQKLRNAAWRYATTGSLAAQAFAPIAPARLGAIYVDDSIRVAEQLGLKPADAGANVRLLEPFDSVVFERTSRRDDLVTVAPTQLAVDLLTGPGREPSEGEELLGWMKENENAWRA